MHIHGTKKKYVDPKQSLLHIIFVQGNLGILAGPGDKHTCQQVPRARHLLTMRVFLAILVKTNPGV